MPSPRATLSSVLLAAALGLGALTGCTASPEPSPTPTASATALSVAESELFAAMRFHNFDIGTRAFTLGYADAGGEIAVHGYVDFPAGLVYGAVAQDDAPVGLMRATHQELSILETEAPADPPLPAPVDGWRSQPLDPSSSPLASGAAVLLSLGLDRPENPQLLRQSDAVSLGTQQLETASGAVRARVFAGPSASGGKAQSVEERARYWIDDHGILLRVEMPRGGAGSPLVLELSDADGVALTP